ncbi:MAG: ribonuclease III [bacterium]
MKKPRYLELLEELNIKVSRELLDIAFTHKSYSEINNNERLEFLGDAVVGLIVAERLYKREPYLSEGEMSKYKAKLVSRRYLSGLAYKLDLIYEIKARGEVDFLRGREKTTILGNALEALIGAIFIESGLNSARLFLEKVFNLETPLEEDYKSKLQEDVQSLYKETPIYRVIGEEGPTHSRRFIAEVVINGRTVGVGYGFSKKEAEQYAAREALNKLYEKEGNK